MKKFVSLLLALMMALSLVACGSKADTTTDDKTDDDTVTEPANALEKIKADGVLTVALSPDFSPMEFVDSSKTGQDQYVGFDITLAKYIAENLGVELAIEPMGFDASQTAVYTGSVPMSISGYSWTEDRAQNYELSDYYYAGENETRQALLIKKADKYTSPEDLAGQDVGAQNASLQMQLVTEQLTDANPISIGDITVGVMELKSGNIEALAVAYGNAEMIVDANPDLVKYAQPSMTCFNYFFNLADADRPTYDLKVRQAICYAIDRQKIIDTILHGSATLADGMIAPIVACYTPTPTYDYDLEKAKQLMAESSYPNGCDLIMVTNQSQQRLEICQVVQKMLKELNINVEISTYEQATYIQALNEHEHDMGFSAWITSTGDADYTYYPCYHSTQKGKPGNRSFFDNPKADELIEKGRSLSDPEARKEVYSELNQIIYENCAAVHLPSAYGRGLHQVCRGLRQQQGRLQPAVDCEVPAELISAADLSQKGLSQIEMH